MLVYARPLSDQERELLNHTMAQPGLPPYIRLRLSIVRLSTQGMSVPEIARELNVTTVTVRKWLNTFNNDGLRQLLVLKRGGGPKPKFSLADEAAIVRIAAMNPRDLGLPMASWSLRELRAYLKQASVVHDISREKLRQILKGCAPSDAWMT